MGSSTFSREVYSSRVATRSLTAEPVFAYNEAVKQGKASGVHKELDPLGVTLREARDSDEHPVTVPVGILLDVTGSMRRTPVIIQENLPNLMDQLIEAKASGKRPLGEGYPAVLIGAIDDYDALRGNGCLQVGQFESGMEIDQTLEKLWLTGGGGGTYEESYELGLYFMANHTVHDHKEKRGRLGYLFIIGDEHPYPEVSAKQVQTVVGAKIDANIPIEKIIAAAQELYHVFMVIPNMTSHYNDKALEKRWVELLGQQNVLKLEDPAKICDLITSAVSICEAYLGTDEITVDPALAALAANPPRPISFVD